MMRCLCFASVLFLNAVSVAAQPLIDAARDSDVSEIEDLLASGSDPNVEGAIGTALHIASLRGDTEVAALLLGAGADANAQSDRLGTPLTAAVSGGGIYGKPNLRRSDIVELLIDAGADVNVQSPEGMSPLHFAVVSGDEVTAELLIKAGADVDAVAMPIDQHNKSFRTGLGNGPTSVLHIALWSEQIGIADKLREAGAAPKPPTKSSLAGDPDRGRAVFLQQCAACHTRREGDQELGGPVQGPTLEDVIGRRVASVESYDYSSAMTDFGGRWDEGRLFAFVLEPKLVVPGTNMTGLMPLSSDTAADIVAFLSVD